MTTGAGAGRDLWLAVPGLAGPPLPGLAQARWLEHYADRFATVESNNAFYRLPEPATFAAWAERTPPDFVMAVKASRFLTHIRRLRDPEPVGRLMDHARHLGAKLGPVLLQLPPTWARPAAPRPDCWAFPAGTGRGRASPRQLVDGEVRDLLTGTGRPLPGRQPAAPRPSGAPPTGPTCASTRAPPPAPATTARPWPPGRTGWPAWSADADAYVYFNNDPGGCAVRAVLVRRGGGRAGLHRPGSLPRRGPGRLARSAAAASRNSAQVRSSSAWNSATMAAVSSG